MDLIKKREATDRRKPVYRDPHIENAENHYSSVKQISKNFCQNRHFHFFQEISAFNPDRKQKLLCSSTSL